MNVSSRTKWTGLILVGLVLIVGMVFQNCSPGRLGNLDSATNTSTNTGGTGTTGTVIPPADKMTVMTGVFGTTATGFTKYPNLRGRAMVVRNVDGTTEVYTHVTGLSLITPYSIHVHNLPCGVNAGGAHYMRDPAGVAGDANNEIWPAFTTDASGYGNGYIKVAHLARSDAQSIVIHEPDPLFVPAAARQACADLYENSMPTTHLGGQFATTATGLGMGLSIKGSAVISRWGNNFTSVYVAVRGLAPTAAGATTIPYPAHVHNLPCGTGAGGGHYMMDPLGTAGDVNNEIWLPITTDANGFGITEVNVRHHARSDAQSIVIHDPANTANRIACVDLNKDANFKMNAPSLAAARDIFGSAHLVRTKYGSTQVLINVAGLAADTDYSVHVHALPCAVANGGGHYKIDNAVATAIDTNEVWPKFKTNTTGVGTATLEIKNLTVRPDAQSVVIHDPANAANRLVCADLE